MSNIDGLLSNLGNRPPQSECRQREKLREQSKMAAGDTPIPAGHPIWDVWQAIRNFYPGVTANWDNEPSPIWYAVLADLSAEQLGKGVQNLVNFTDDRGSNSFPPNAGQFRDLCLCNYGWEHARQSRTASEVLLDKPYDVNQERRLSAPKDDRTPEDHLSAMSELFGNNA